MPTPLGHGIIGLAIYAGATKTSNSGLNLTRKGAALVLFASFLPDLDFIPGIIAGEHFAFHHGPSHSLFFGLVAGIALSFFSRKILSISPVRGAILFTSLIWMHIFLDMTIIDSRPDNTPGVQLFYPLSSMHVKSPVDLFFVEVGTKGSINPKHLLTPNNITALFLEIVVATIIAYLVYFLLIKIRSAIQKRR